MFHNTRVKIFQAVAREGPCGPCSRSPSPLAHRSCGQPWPLPWWKDKTCSFLLYKHLEKWCCVRRVGMQFQIDNWKNKNATNFQSSVNDALLFAVPTTPAVVLKSIMLFENELPLTCTCYFLKENELVGKLFARRVVEINGVALYVSVCGNETHQALHRLLRTKWASKRLQYQSSIKRSPEMSKLHK